MIQSLYELGLALKTKDKYKDYFASYSDPFAGFDGEAYVIVLEIEEDEVVGSTIETYQRGNANRYLYRKPKGARGAPLVATGPFYPVHSLETEKQQQTQVENVEKIVSRIARSIPDGKSVYFSSTSAKLEGIKEISRLLYLETGAKENRYIYTVTVNDKYLGEIPELRELLDEEAYTKYYEKSKSSGKTCSLSHDQNVEVWGRVDTLGFTVNDIAFSRSGFAVKDSYRMFPVSKPSALALEAARRYAFAKLTDRFYTLEYLMVPRSIDGSPEQLMEIAEHMTVSRDNKSLTTKAIPIAKANGLIDLVVDQGQLKKEGILFDLLFFQRNQAQLALLLHLQDIPPTRLGQIKQAINDTSRRYGRAFGYTDSKTKEFRPFQINLGAVKNFFSTGKGLKINFDPFFFKLLENMFYEQQVQEATVVTALMSSIRTAFKNDGDGYHLPFHITVQQAIATRSLFGRLGLFTTSTLSFMSEQTDPITLRRDKYLEEHAPFFESQPALKGAFLVGVLTSMLAYAQYDHLRNKPFLNRLNNLNLGLDELRGLVPQLLNKIHQYQQRKNGKAPPHKVVTDITAAASTLLMEGKRPSRDDLSFAFTTGMVMQDKFAIDVAKERIAKKEAEATSTAS
jgi:CRISPR-associated Csh1 family protein